MSDEQEPPRPDETRPDGVGRPGPAGNHPDDGPRPGDAWVGDRTEQMPGGLPPSGDDATVVTPRHPQPDETSVLPPARDWSAEDAAWAGRAQVRPPRPGQADYGVGADWDAEPPVEPRGKWWTPILVGVVALILLGLLGWGIYLITRAEDGDETPAPATTASAPAATKPTPTTAAPTTTTPTTEPTESTNPAEVTVPALIGLSGADAQQALQRRGLRFRVISRPSDATPGTVIDSDPAEGQQVPADTQVTLVIAVQRTTPTTRPTTSPPAGPDGQPDED